jgi:hypothetical protein
MREPATEAPPPRDLRDTRRDDSAPRRKTSTSVVTVNRSAITESAPLESGRLKSFSPLFSDDESSSSSPRAALSFSLALSSLLRILIRLISVSFLTRDEALE